MNAKLEANKLSAKHTHHKHSMHCFQIQTAILEILYDTDTLDDSRILKEWCFWCNGSPSGKATPRIPTDPIQEGFPGTFVPQTKAATCTETWFWQTAGQTLTSNDVTSESNAILKYIPMISCLTFFNYMIPVCLCVCVLHINVHIWWYRYVPYLYTWTL